MALKPPEKQTVLERYVPIDNWLPGTVGVSGCGWIC
jgi:hypothetical protein